jgi:serine/threonine-protein kinase
MKTDRSIKKSVLLAFISFAVLVVAALGALYYLFPYRSQREMIEIPCLVGKRLDDIGELDRIELVREPAFSDDVPEGEVISQFPYGGAKRKLADGEKYTVKLTVSIGKELQIVPNLQNYQYSDAAAALRTIGAKIKIVSVYDDEKERDLVLRTLPEAGERIERGQTVTLFVSRNHIHGSVCVKDFTGMPQSDAVTEMLAQGLALGKIKQEYSDEYDVGVVISQSVKKGSYVLH